MLHEPLLTLGSPPLLPFHQVSTKGMYTEVLEIVAVPYHPAVAAVSDYRAMAMAMAMGWKVTSSFIECSQ
jgi:hypothetical protein